MEYNIVVRFLPTITNQPKGHLKMNETKLKNVKPGDFFTLTPHEEPTERQVWVMDGYDRSTRQYEAHRFTDVNHGLANGDGNRTVFVGFTF